MAGKLKVLVLCGGRSAEHQVSLVSAKTILDHLDRKRYDPELVLIDPGGRWLKADARKLTDKVGTAKELTNGSKPVPPAERLSGRLRPDVVFPILHGPLGEDGTMQGLLEVEGVPYVGCGVLGSAVGMDKEATKLLALQAGIPILPYLVAHQASEARQAPARLGLPLFVKPARLGSSVGVSKVKTPQELAAALKNAFQFDDKVILEKGVPAREIECAVLGDPWSADPRDALRLRASVCGEITPKGGYDFYDYKSKYLDPEGASLSIPAKIPSDTAERVRGLALRAFKALDGYGMGRADFLMDKETGSVYFNEVNTIPGFTPASMYPLLWKESGVATPELLTRLVELALRRHKARSKLKTSPA